MIATAHVLLLVAAATGPRIVTRGPVPPEIQAEASRRGWEVISGEAAPDAARATYLTGSISEVLYAASRTPGAWTAALAVGGSPEAAIASNRIFATNFALLPVLWAGPPESAAGAEALRARIPSLQFRPAAGFGVKDAFDWLAQQPNEPLPVKVDCETVSPDSGRCYWAEIVKIDAARRNDILPSTRIVPGSGAALALGGFGYDPAAPGPGVLVISLPPGYKGPLKLRDRIVALAGKPIEDSRHYRELMDQVKEEKPTAVLVQRGKERLRIETRIALPKRDQTVAGRLQAEYIQDAHEVMVVTRGVGAFRLTIAPHWTPLRITWNGNEAGEVGAGGCWAVDETEKATRCER